MLRRWDFEAPAKWHVAAKRTEGEKQEGEKNVFLFILYKCGPFSPSIISLFSCLCGDSDLAVLLILFLENSHKSEIAVREGGGSI